MALISPSKKRMLDDGEQELLLEITEDKISHINQSWEEFVNEVGLFSPKSIEVVEEERNRLAQAIINFEKYFEKG